jgi:hypothetical protein
MTTPSHRCLGCGHAASAGTFTCPDCGLTADPLKPEEDLQIAINWLELRILAEWASRAIRHQPPEDDMQRALAAILDRLRPYRPQGAAALTLREVLAEQQAAGEGVPLRQDPHLLPAALYVPRPRS